MAFRKKVSKKQITDEPKETVEVAEVAKETAKPSNSLSPDLNYVKCRNCGCVHYSITLMEGYAQAKKLIEHFDSLTRVEQKAVYKDIKPTIYTFQQCTVCGGPHKNFDNIELKDVSQKREPRAIIHRNE